MKLALVFMLVALPMCYCSGDSSGCQLMDKIVNRTIDPSVSVEQYQTTLKSYYLTPLGAKALANFKNCFLEQSNETLANYQVMMRAIYNSKDCQTS